MPTSLKVPENIVTELIDAGRELYRRNMVPATSGNLSARLPEGKFAITASGVHKGKLTPGDILLLNNDGSPSGPGKPSAETALHLQIYRHFPEASYVLHPHSIYATLISGVASNEIILEDYELLKAFPGVSTHDCRVAVPLYDNDQNISRLAKRIEERMKQSEPLFGYLLVGHGFYTWGETIESCLNHVEAFEFLFECEIKRRSLRET